MANYCTLQDIRDEGFTVGEASDARVAVALALSTVYIDRFCGQWFEPREFDSDTPYLADGDTSPVLVLPIPICSVSKITLVSRGIGTASTTELDEDSYVVYNRHLSGQVGGADDDRDFPRIELVDALEGRWSGLWEDGRPAFAEGPQSVMIEGFFGYTDRDPDGIEDNGVTPPLITHVAKLLVVRELETLRKRARRATWRDRARIVSAKTKDQSYTLAQLAQGGFLTGDPEIDGILSLYQRPARVGSA